MADEEQPIEVTLEPQEGDDITLTAADDQPETVDDQPETIDDQPEAAEAQAEDTGDKQTADEQPSEQADQPSDEKTEESAAEPADQPAAEAVDQPAEQPADQQAEAPPAAEDSQPAAAEEPAAPAEESKGEPAEEVQQADSMAAEGGTTVKDEVPAAAPPKAPATPPPPENTLIEVESERKDVETSNTGTGITPREAGQPPGQVTQQMAHLQRSVTPEEQTAYCTVKVMLLPSGQMHTTRSSLQQTLRGLKDYFSRELKIPANSVLLMFNGKGMKDSTTLASLGVGPNGTIQLEITSSDPTKPIKVLPPKAYQMPDVITVRVPTDTGELRDVVVEIERSTTKKAFLGGFRHKKTGAVFHHASAQTVKKPKPPSGIDKFSRDTQTAAMKHAGQQTFNDTSTQMTDIGVYVSNMQDKLVTPGKYQTADAAASEKLEQLIIIQKYYRRWLAERKVKRVQADLAERLEWERQEQERKQREKELRIKREFERRMNPKSKEDFDLLYSALEKWRLEELDRINESLSGAERKAALCSLLEQETNLLSAIDRHKNDADKENKQKLIQQFLDKASAPKKWKGRDGNYTEMDTPFTIRAKELKEIYNSINMKFLTQDERLDVLLTLKHTVREHYCKLTQEIIELVDREADLLMRGVKDNNLEGLRKRISTLFLQYIKTPTFNPEAARLIKVPQDPMSLVNNIYYCACCRQYKQSTEFQLRSNSSTMGHCRQCEHIDNAARVRQDLSMYRFMLRQLQKREEQVGDGSQIPYLLQESDVRYLVENVWQRQSVLSAESDLYNLMLIRWDKLQIWSPWNCILLTKEEAAAHEKLVKLSEAYSKPLIEKVAQKHVLARNYFSRLPRMTELLQQRTRSQQQASGGNTGPAVNGGPAPTAVH